MGIVRMIAVEGVASALFLVPLFGILNHMRFRNWCNSLSYLMFAMYLATIYILVGMPNVTYIRFALSGNLIPFVGMIQDLKNSILNVCLFVPLGFLLPMLWDKFRERKKTLLFGLGLSLAIELLQIFTLRATDVNDLITNTLGTYLGFFIANILIQKFPFFKSISKGKKVWELYLVCGAVLMVMFFLQPFSSSLLWGMILG